MVPLLLLVSLSLRTVSLTAHAHACTRTCTRTHPHAPTGLLPAAREASIHSWGYAPAAAGPCPGQVHRHTRHPHEREGSEPRRDVTVAAPGETGTAGAGRGLTQQLWE